MKLRLRSWSSLVPFSWSTKSVLDNRNRSKSCVLNLVQGLENYRNFGPPSVPKTLVMSVEDENFSKDHKEWEMEDNYEVFEDMDGDLDDVFEEDGSNGEVSPSENHEADVEDMSNFTCSHCCKNLDEENQRDEVTTIHATTKNEENMN